MAKNNILKSNAFTSITQYKAICVEKDFRGEWRSTKKEAIQDALAHQQIKPSHKMEILVQQKQRYQLTIKQDEIDDTLR